MPSTKERNYLDVVLTVAESGEANPIDLASKPVITPVGIIRHGDLRSVCWTPSSMTLPEMRRTALVEGDGAAMIRSMTITLYHHPFSRAASAVWTLEEIGEPYDLRFVDIMAGAQKSPELVALNPMGKLPILTDGDAVVTENAAIALYLADRYASGRLAPRLDDPKRATYLRWSLFAPSVIEPGAMAKAGGWEFKPGQAGWGAYDTMLATMESALDHRDFVLGDTFSIADVIFGGTIRYMLRFGMIEARPVFTAYSNRLGERPALQRADARNAAVMAEHGLGK